MKSELETLKEQVKLLEEKQRNCEHDWEEPVRDTMEEPVYETVWVGIDCFPAPTGEVNTVECWSRTCKKCGKKEYTRTMQEVPVVTTLRPKF